MERCYVIDLAVPKDDFVAACAAYGELFGMEPVHTGAVHSTTGETDMMHFPVGGLNAFGVMTVLKEPGSAGAEAANVAGLSRFLSGHPNGGIYLLGHLVDDIDGWWDTLAGRGIPLDGDGPRPYPDGRLLVTQVVHGTVWEFGQHHGPQVTGVWNGLRGEAAGAGIERAYRVDVAVRDLDAAVEAVRKITGREPGPRVGLTDDGAIEGVDFPVKGLAATGLVTLNGKPKGAMSQAIADHLDRYGEGPVMAGFHVQDLQDTRARVEKVGGKLQYASDQPSAEGTTNITDPIHGVVFQFTQPAR
jgi:predicted enzyme related to lactoylglutathione lyase